MHYFRYRPFNEISLKELMYSEMYFASPEECNDPFDSKAYYIFNDDIDKWTKVILLACKQYSISLSEKLLHKLAEHIGKMCPFSFDDVINKNLFETFLTNDSQDALSINYLSRAIREIFKVYRPSTRYFVSFSRTNSESLMWSHYSDRHKGYCLIFKAINNELLLSPNFKKDQISRVTPNGIAPEMSFGLPEKFKFINIEYKPKVEFLNAFLHMPAFVSGNAKDEQERLNIISNQESHYQQKGENWFYENESRLILPPPPSWLFGGHIEYSKQERLFHYEPSQLAGIVYGARMSDEDRNRIREILKFRKESSYRTQNYKRIVFNFVEFQAKLSTSERDVIVEPIKLNSYKPTDSDFERLFSEWNEGVGYERSDSGSKWVKVD